MKAVAATRPGVVEVVDLPMPELREYECLVKMRSCGFCATDIKIIENHISNMTVNYPVILGHEGIGEVVEVGPKVKNINVGDRYLNPPWRIPKETGFTPMWANMVEYALVQDHDVMREMGLERSCFTGAGAKLPADLDPIESGVLLALSEAYSGIRNFGVVPGADLLIYGDGPIALALANFARIEGAGWIGVVGHHDSRLQRIAELGKVDLTINSGTQSVPDAMGDRRVNLVIDAVGMSAIIREGSSLCKPGGKVGVYGVVPAHDATLSLLDLRNNTALHMLNWPHGADAARPEVIDLIRAGKIVPTDYYTHVMPIDQAAEAYALIKRRETFRVTLGL